VTRWPEQTLIYLDPPYYVKGRDLYHDFYEPDDHAEIATFISTSISRQQWIVSYDNVKPIRDLYKGSRHVVYNIGYSARSASQGSEVMFFGRGLKIPALIGPIQMTENLLSTCHNSRVGAGLAQEATDGNGLCKLRER
jgi:DNA adenine methylase